MALDKVRRRLDVLHVRYFLPMCRDVVVENGTRVKKMVPALKDFIFLYASAVEISRLMDSEHIPLSFYYSHYSHVQNDALWVREAEMEEFMKAVTAYDRSPRIQPCGRVPFRKGLRIRVVNGPLKGIEGDYVQLKRGQKKRLVLTLADWVVVDLVLAPEDLIEIMDS